jgi:YjgF/chorismate_mutase-like, putative endoribonuclease
MIASQPAARSILFAKIRDFIVRPRFFPLSFMMLRGLVLDGGMSLGKCSILFRRSITRSPSVILGSISHNASSPSSSLHNQHHQRFVHIERRLEELKIILPPPPTPKANYNLICKTGNLLFVSGHLPLLPDGFLLTGRIGREEAGGESIEAGYEAARHCGLNIISTLKEHLGDLDRIKQIVKVRVPWDLETLAYVCWNILYGTH